MLCVEDFGMLSLEDALSLVKIAMKKEEKRKALEAHKYKIYQGKDGRWYTRFPDASGGSKQRAFKTKDDLEEAVSTYYKETVVSETFRDIFKLALNERAEEGSISDPTVKRYEVDYERFYLEFGETRVSSLTTEMVEEFVRAKKIEFSLGLKAYSHLTSVLRLTLKYAKRKKLIDFRIEDVLSDMDWGKNAFRKEEDGPEVFTDFEMERLVEHFKENQNGRTLGFLLLFATGLRIGELAALKWEDVDDLGIHVRRTERSWSDSDGHFHCEVVDFPKTKAGRRVVPIPASVAWIVEKLREINPDGEYVFMNKGSRTRTVYFRKALFKACDSVGIKRRSPHKIRKTYASILLDNGVASKTVKENMGHESIITTDSSYARRRKSAKQQASVVDAIPEFRVLEL